MDGIDAALVHTYGGRDQLIGSTSTAYPTVLKKRIYNCAHDPETPLHEVADLVRLVGESFAKAALKAMQKFKHEVGPQQIAVIGSHGQNIYHHPESHVSVQIGDGNIIAARTGITTVCNFRMADIALGGEGAPILPYYHRRLFAAQARQGMTIQNLGGIANLTYLGPKNTIFGFDTGPANCMIDDVLERLSDGRLKYDRGGALARKGEVNWALYDLIWQHKEVARYRQQKPPKSTGRELYNADVLQKAMAMIRRKKISKVDAIATITRVSAALTAEAYRKWVLPRHPLSEIVLAGGGSKNKIWCGFLAEELDEFDLKFSTAESHGVNASVLEAQAFAYYGLCALAGKPVNVPAVTGAKRETICGQIIPGQNWHSLPKSWASL